LRVRECDLNRTGRESLDYNRQGGIAMHRRAPALGFTLVELVIVVLILGILASVATFRVLIETEESTDVVTARNRASIQDALDHQYALTGSYPATVETEWFRGNHVPAHPYQPAGVPLIEYVDTPGEDNPTDIVLTTSSDGAYWYNRAEGILRARVPFDDTNEDTVELYDEFNQTGLLDDFEEEE